MRINTGYSPEYLLREVATGRENYYTGAVAEGEPPGRWSGAGAEQLGLSGLVEPEVMRAVFERFKDPREDGFSDPDRWDEVNTLGHAGRKYATEQELYDLAVEQEPNASAERRAELWTLAGQQARHNVAFFDVTFSVQKSITLVHTAFEAREVAARNAGDIEEAEAWAAFRVGIEDAIWAGHHAGMEFLQEHAGYTRVGHHGGAGGRYADAHGFVVASFFQHDSREGDPQLHIHGGLLNRVQGPDGAWRTIDGRSLHRWRPAAAAVAERTTEERATAAIGLLFATRPDGKAREITGVVAEAMGLISTRRHQVTVKTGELIAEFEQRHGRTPNSYEQERLAQAATLVTRKGKSHEGVSRAELLDRVEAQMRAEITGGLGAIAEAVIAARPDELRAVGWSPREVIAVALADVQSSKAAWTKADLMAALNRALPDHLGVADGRDIGTLLSSLADDAIGAGAVEVLSAAGPGDDALPAEYRLADGSSALTAPGGTLYAVGDHVHTERALARAAGVRDGAVLADSSVTRFLQGLEREGVTLGAAQEAAVRGVLTSGARVETLVGPPGTGKSFLVGTLARAWTDPELTGGPQRRVFGVATAQVAADVLAEHGLTARNTAAWLATQARIRAGRGQADDLGFALRAGDIVVVDESAMADTAALAAVQGHVEAAGAKLLLVGDPRQLAAIGAGGGMALVAASGAPSYELNEARRFTAEWERDASLRLREGDPAVLDDYYRRGRLRDCGSLDTAEASAAEAWLADTLAGKRSLLLVDDNPAADRIAAQLRARLVDLGLVDEDGVRLGLTGAFAGVGDWVEARAIGHDLAGYHGNRRGPHTRELFRVLAVRPDGGLEVTTDLTRRNAADSDGAGGAEETDRMVLSPRYVAEHLALGYAGTRYCGQGATVDTAHSVITGRTGHAAALVGLTRGQEENTAHCATVAGADDPADGGAEHDRHRSPQAILRAAIDVAEPDRAALTISRDQAEWAGSLQTITERLTEASHRAATGRTAAWLDRLTDHGALTAAQRDQLAAEDGAADLTRILRRAEIAGHDPYALLQAAVEKQSLATARNLTNTIHHRLQNSGSDFTPAGHTWAARIPAVENPATGRYLEVLAEAADARTAELAALTASEPPRWATDLFGPVPDADADPGGRAEWERKAGAVAGYREMTLGRTDGEPSDAAAAGPPVEAGEVLGLAPTPGRPEAYAAFRAGWEALGRPAAEREELEMSDGQLYVRSRAWEREQATAPPYVADDLAGTRQAADDQRRAVALRRAEADAATDPAAAAQLRAAAEEAAAHATELDRRAGELEEVNDARNRWLLRNARTQLEGERADHALAARNADRAPDPLVTAEEWIAAHDIAVRAEEADRPVTEDDITEHHPADADRRDAGDHGRAAELGEPGVLETGVADIRELAAQEEQREPEHAARVATNEEVIESTSRARRALAESRAREDYEAAQAAEEDRDADLSREDPHADDGHADDSAADD